MRKAPPKQVIAKRTPTRKAAPSVGRIFRKSLLAVIKKVKGPEDIRAFCAKRLRVDSFAWEFILPHALHEQPLFCDVNNQKVERTVQHRLWSETNPL